MIRIFFSFLLAQIRRFFSPVVGPNRLTTQQIDLATNWFAFYLRGEKPEVKFYFRLALRELLLFHPVLPPTDTVLGRHRWDVRGLVIDYDPCPVLQYALEQAGTDGIGELPLKEYLYFKGRTVVVVCEDGNHRVDLLSWTGQKILAARRRSRYS
jgi:hypothetical protein